MKLSFFLSFFLSRPNNAAPKKNSSPIPSSLSDSSLRRSARKAASKVSSYYESDEAPESPPGSPGQGYLLIFFGFLNF